MKAKYVNKKRLRKNQIKYVLSRTMKAEVKSVELKYPAGAELDMPTILEKQGLLPHQKLSGWIKLEDIVVERIVEKITNPNFEKNFDL